MASESKRLFICGQFCLYVFLAVSILLKPEYLKGNGGLSNYGVHWPSVISYSLAFLSASGFTFASAFFMRPVGSVRDRFKFFLYIYASLLLLLLASTYFYKHSDLLRNVHILIGSLLLLYQLVVSIWVYFKINRSFIITALVLLQLAAVIIGGLSLRSILDLLLASQILSALSFGLAIIYSFND